MDELFLCSFWKILSLRNPAGDFGGLIFGPGMLFGFIGFGSHGDFLEF